MVASDSTTSTVDTSSFNRGFSSLTGFDRL
jgi:hypothetical protein